MAGAARAAALRSGAGIADLGTERAVVVCREARLDLRLRRYVERRYKSCADDVSFTPKPGDLCWETDNAFLSLHGRSVELVRNDATGAWHPARRRRVAGRTPLQRGQRRPAR